MNKAFTVYAPTKILEECGNDFTNNPRAEFEPGFAAALDREHFYLKVVATLPLKAFDEGLQFGFWVELQKDDYVRFFDNLEEDESYMKYEATATTANDWPGFPGTLGLKVKIRPINVERGLYITEVLDLPQDMALAMALNLSVNDKEQIEKLRNMVVAFYSDMGITDFS